jgi:hypothetical protein
MIRKTEIPTAAYNQVQDPRYNNSVTEPHYTSTPNIKEIPKQLGMLMERVATINKLVETLGEKLDPIIVSKPKVDSTSSSNPACITRLANEILTAHLALNLSVDRLSDLIEGIQL